MLREISLRGTSTHRQGDGVSRGDRGDSGVGGGSGRFEIQHGPQSPSTPGATSPAMAMGIPVFNEDTNSQRRMMTAGDDRDGGQGVHPFSSSRVEAADQCRGQPLWQARNLRMAAWLLYSFSAVQVTAEPCAGHSIWN